MGIYANENYRKDKNGNLVHTHEIPGVTTTTIYIPVVTIEHRDNCYCCSCYENENGYVGNMDVYCRNHGWDGARPCELHDMPGSPENIDSVQTVRREQALRRARNRSYEDS